MPVFYSLITIDLIFGSGADSVKKSEIRKDVYELLEKKKIQRVPNTSTTFVNIIPSADTNIKTMNVKIAIAKVIEEIKKQAAQNNKFADFNISVTFNVSYTQPEVFSV